MNVDGSLPFQILNHLQFPTEETLERLFPVEKLGDVTVRNSQIARSDGYSREVNPNDNRHKDNNTQSVQYPITYDNILIYTKGKISRIDDRDRFYILISSKRSL